MLLQANGSGENFMTNIACLTGAWKMFLLMILEAVLTLEFLVALPKKINFSNNAL